MDRERLSGWMLWLSFVDRVALGAVWIVAASVHHKIRLVGGAGGNRTRVLERRTRPSPGAVSAVVFSASTLALTRRRQAQSG
jgi:hypothetical protein